MPQLNPYIHFNGNAEEAFTFYKSVFGGDFSKIIRFKDISNPEYPVPESEENKIMQIVLPIGNNSVLMASDVPDVMGQVNENENRSKIYISAENRVEAGKLFTGLSAGGTIEVPIDDNSLGSCFGMFRDKYGIEWMINFESNTSQAID
jgi:PhnB protein